MSKALSPTMKEASEAMRLAGRFDRRPGGYWGPPDAKWNGSQLYPSWGTNTVDALVMRGVGQYTDWQAGRNGRFPIRVEPTASQKPMSLRERCENCRFGDSGACQHPRQKQIGAEACFVFQHREDA